MKVFISDNYQNNNIYVFKYYIMRKKKQFIQRKILLGIYNIKYVFMLCMKYKVV